ncbi:MAG: undecaprenyl/decaprenyl-phosphate alpha-N-acetylglucosaminyl 1-phosphate transferase [Phycisphaerae bacterium]|nr:undecaprenyl/decaprenyl-phosphate alpha-N-acetylglucosaminyl 1-phosphate transferase [Phycisphaerae bacterium]
MTELVAQLGTPPVSPALPASAADRAHELAERSRALADLLSGDGSGLSRFNIFQGYIAVLAVAFLITLVSTPLMRRLAVANGIIDRPSEARKVHRIPVAYLGGVAVYLGILGAILLAYTAPFHHLIDFHPSRHLTENPLDNNVPLSVLAGMTVIMLIGLLDDVVGISPRLKIGGQLFAAAVLALDNVGVSLAGGLMKPFGAMIGNVDLVWHIPVPIPGFPEGIRFDLIYWTGTALIAIFVLGSCNASNLIDGLDGLLSGVTTIVAAGILIIALTLAYRDDGPRDPARIILCLAVMGACLGFLPHNFNPASIFLGDTGSMLLGFSVCALILTLGDTGKTHLVLAGLIIYAIPIIDTTLAIFRRKVSGKRISDADDQHLHHMLKRALGVKGAVFALYGIGIGFAALGVAMSLGGGRLTYALTMIFAAFIGVTAFKIARRNQIEHQAALYDAARSPANVSAAPAPSAAAPSAARSA